MQKLLIYYILLLVLSLGSVGAEELPIIEHPTMSFIGDERIDGLVQYAYNHCIGSIGTGSHKENGRNYSCINLILVWTAENGGRDKNKVSPTSDYGFCQLNYRRHKDFINSSEFQDEHKQLDYCQEVRQDAYKKGKMPWMAYGNRNNVKNRFAIK